MPEQSNTSNTSPATAINQENNNIPIQKVNPWFVGCIRNCSEVVFKDWEYAVSKQSGEITMIAQPGQDGFNLPRLHQAANLARLMIEVCGDFQLRARCQHDGISKFDAAGLYVESCTYSTHRLGEEIIPPVEMSLKYGVEHYGDGSPRLVSVMANPLSDEACGSRLGTLDATLILTRIGDILTCYSVQAETTKLASLALERMHERDSTTEPGSEQIVFQRALGLANTSTCLSVGFFVQAPFSQQPVQARFSQILLTNQPIDHLRC